MCTGAGVAQHGTLLVGMQGGGVCRKVSDERGGYSAPYVSNAANAPMIYVNCSDSPWTGP